MTGRILVTGAAGFLGSAVVHYMHNAGLPVTATDCVESANLSGVKNIPANILDPLSISSAFEDVDHVIHVAGLAHIRDKKDHMGPSFHNVNVVGTQNVARAAIKNGVKNFVFISSVSVYGGAAHSKDENSECHPEGPYAESKLQAERFLIDLCEKEGMNLIILRLATLYGEEDPGNMARLIRAIDRGRFIWVGSGTNLKSLLHRADAARACIEVIKNPMPGINIYNISAPARSMKDIVETISVALEKQVPAWCIPASLALNSAKIMKNLSFNHGRFGAVHGTLLKWLADDYYKTDKFCRTFNFQTQVSLEEGIRREVEWYKT